MLSVLKKLLKILQEDPILNELRELIKLGKNYTLKNKSSLNPYCKILSEITCVSNSTLLKNDNIILPETLWKGYKTSSQWCALGTKWFNSKMEKLFIYQKFRKVSCWICKSLSYCQIFTNQVYRHPIKASKVCER